jgi:hypothetical protein
LSRARFARSPLTFGPVRPPRRGALADPEVTGRPTHECVGRSVSDVRVESTERFDAVRGPP